MDTMVKGGVMQSLRAVYDTTTADVSAVLNNFRQTLIRYEGQVEQLIQENEALKKEIENLKKSAETKDNK
jgi:cell division protein FtsB